MLSYLLVLVFLFPVFLVVLSFKHLIIINFSFHIQMWFVKLPGGPIGPINCGFNSASCSETADIHFIKIKHAQNIIDFLFDFTSQNISTNLANFNLSNDMLTAFSTSNYKPRLSSLTFLTNNWFTL